jgi:hypothetical protein
LRDFRRKMEKNGKASQETMACIHVRIWVVTVGMERERLSKGWKKELWIQRRRKSLKRLHELELPRLWEWGQQWLKSDKNRFLEKIINSYRQGEFGSRWKDMSEPAENTVPTPEREHRTNDADRKWHGSLFHYFNSISFFILNVYVFIH